MPFSLEPQQLRSLHDQLQSSVSKWEGHGSQLLMELLRGEIQEECWGAVERGLREGQLTVQDLRFLCAYFCDFLPAHTPALRTRKRRLELRTEGFRLYVLTDLDDSLLSPRAFLEGEGGGVATALPLAASSLPEGATLSWVHDEEWAKGRFLERGEEGEGEPFLCGQFLGKSKFVTLALMPEEVTKAQALELLGLKGYATFDNEGPLYLVTCRATDHVLRMARPMVPLLYKLREERWLAAPNFAEGSIPGFTSGGSGEVVIDTFEVEAPSLLELAKRGIACRALP